MQHIFCVQYLLKRTVYFFFSLLYSVTISNMRFYVPSQ